MDLIMSYSDKDGSLNYSFDETSRVSKPSKPIKIRNCPQILLNYIENLYFSNEQHELKTILCKAVAENQRMIIQEFKTIYTQLQKDGFNNSEISEIVAYLYSRNYEFFSGSHCAEYLKIEILEPTVFKYNKFCSYATKAKNIIDTDGHIMPQNIKFDENTRKILTFEGFLEIPDNLLKLIIATCNKAFFLEEKKNIQKADLEALFQKAREEEQITIKEIERMQSLMTALNYDSEVIITTITHLQNRYNTRQETKRRESKQNNQSIQSKAHETISFYYTYINGNLVLNAYKIISEEEINLIKESLHIMGCSKKRINELVNEIYRQNRVLKEKERNTKIASLKNQMFNKLSQEKSIEFSASAEVLYETAIKMINNSLVENNLRSYISKLEYLINYINEIIYSKINEDIISITISEFTEEDLTEIQLAFLEIDECFENICFINPMIRIRLENDQT